MKNECINMIGNMKSYWHTKLLCYLIIKKNLCDTNFVQAPPPPAIN